MSFEIDTVTEFKSWTGLLAIKESLIPWGKVTCH